MWFLSNIFVEKEIAKQIGNIRQPHDSLRAFLLATLAAPLNGSGQRIIHQFCDMYEHARHDPSEFANDEYEAYHRLFLKLYNAYDLLNLNLILLLLYIYFFCFFFLVQKC